MELLKMTPQQSANPLLRAEHLYAVLNARDSIRRISKLNITLPGKEG